MTLNCDLDLESVDTCIESSAHLLTDIKIWVWFNENRSEGSGYMEGTPNSRVKPMTLICDIDL